MGFEVPTATIEMGFGTEVLEPLRYASESTVPAVQGSGSLPLLSSASFLNTSKLP